MTDFERRLAEALESGADPDPDVTGLAAGARDRARRRTRSRAAGAVAAVVLAVVAVPVVASLGRGDGSAAPDVVDTPTPSPSVAAVDRGWRTETYRDLEIDVPPSWGYGNLPTWCLNGRSEPGTPVVERPGGVVPTIGCSHPGNGYGAEFIGAALLDSKQGPGELEQTAGGAGPETYPVGSWVGYRLDDSGDVAVVVVTRTEQQAREILDSARTVEGADSNGCAIGRDNAAPAVAAGTVAVCRYDPQRLLERSELLTGPDAAAAMAAVAAAPVGGAYGPGPCLDRAEPFGSVLLRLPDRDYSVVFESSCVHDNGIRWGPKLWDLTEDVLYWAMSPGASFVTYGDVPRPDPPRK